MMRNLLIICAIAIGFTACEKPAGEGGTSTISGNITYFTTTFNAQTSNMDTIYYPKSSKDVYIIYSDNENDIFDDKKHVSIEYANDENTPHFLLLILFPFYF